MVHQYGMRHTVVLLLIAGSAISWLPVSQASETMYDTVILGGRVIDPESKLDQIANVGIKDGQISAIGSDAIAGLQQIDANGQVVSPGLSIFIRTRQHGWASTSTSSMVLPRSSTLRQAPGHRKNTAIITSEVPNFTDLRWTPRCTHAVMEGRVHSYFFTEDGHQYD